MIKEALTHSNATGIAFAGIPFPDYCSGIEPSFERREAYERWWMEGEGIRQGIANADIQTAELNSLYRDGIRSHPDYGPNSTLYVQCGYVADNQRRSGLTRRSSEELPATGSAV
jgi:hypothetical protein